MAQVTLVQCDVCQRNEKGGFPSDWKKFSAGFQMAAGPLVELDLCPTCQVKVATALEQLATSEQPTVLGPMTLESIETMEQRHIIQVLTAVNWNKSQAAQVLGIERSTLDRKLKAYGVGRPENSRATCNTARLRQLEFVIDLREKAIDSIILEFQLPEDLIAQLQPYRLTGWQGIRSDQLKLAVLEHIELSRVSSLA